MSDDPKLTKSQLLKDQIRAWDNRAKMARQQGMDDLVRQALEHKRKFENCLAQVQEFEVDES
jgi:phage shock protein A